MIAAWNNFFASIAALFSALNKGCNALDHLAGETEKAAAAYSARASLERDHAYAQLKQLTAQS